ncbi:hypothetical protein UFOVP257_455 [uncultured Caudovirales phage]|uniref:Baseplate hub assembly protein, bacteriophage T4-like n=1 Tax=uncultured Caudovirales phage TaxID=2100421 RepID=A0A6J5LK66_9CAUD|nr:hypothetical protein UFOVP257_455 [uncultured Caudovirales phage]
MAIPAANPLFKHFRQPAIYLKLPSGGQFWDKNSIDLPVTGEIPIYPMTVKDEITFKTPDALMNGSGVVDVIQSCCPNIKDAWKIPTTDIDPILIAIRLASYGHEMDISSKCPHCGDDNENTLDLRIVLDSLPMVDFKSVKIDNLVFQFKPQVFKNLNDTNLITFEQERLIRAINNSELDSDQKMTEFNKIFPNLTDMSIMVIVNSIQSITTEDGTVVSDISLIKEFIHNCDRQVFNLIKDEIDNISKKLKLKPITITCSECTNQYESDLSFEQSNFFE